MKRGDSITGRYDRENIFFRFLLGFKQHSIPIVILVFLDQLIKIIIANKYFNTRFTIINSILGFHPIVNKKLTWFGNYFEILSNPVITILLNILVIIIFVTGFNYYRSKNLTVRKYANFIYIIGLSGCICSFVDKVFWGGSLDYIQIPNLFIFDLKDCYINLSLILFCCVVVINNKEISISDYLRFCFKGKKGKGGKKGKK